MIQLTMGNFLEKKFWSQETWWQDVNQCKLNKCTPRSIYEVKSTYFWIISFKKITKLEK